MRRGTRQAFQLVLIVLGFVTLGAWCDGIGWPVLIWGLRAGTPLVMAGVCWLFYRASRRPDPLPNPLREIAAKYFERKGLCFAPVLETSGDSCQMSVYFQNRYESHVSAMIEVLPPRRTFWFGRHDLPTVVSAVECPGGAFGAMRVPFPIPKQYQGRQMRFDIAADVKYRARKGKLLHVREGTRVDAIGQTRQWSALLFLFAGVGLVPVLCMMRSAGVRLQLPKGVFEALPQGAAPTTDILWAPELPTHGFPITPVKTAA